MISSFNSLILFLNRGLWFLNLKNSSLIKLSSWAAVWNFRPLYVAGTKGTSNVFSIEPEPASTLVIPQPPSSSTALSRSLSSCSLSNG